MTGLDFKNKKVLVLGWAKSGKAATKRLLELGAHVTVANRDAIEEDDEVKALKQEGVAFIDNDKGEALAADTDVLVKNPGIAYTHPIIEKAMSLGLPVLTEVAVALSTFTGRLIIVTGSNGKTTTTTLLGHMLQHDDKQGRVVIAGNIGTPVCQVVGDMTAKDTLVLELSSFQLVGIPHIAADIAVITNVFANHLDFHQNRENYLAAKERVALGQKAGQTLILNGNGPDTPAIAKLTAGTVLTFNPDDEKAYAHEDAEGNVVLNGKILMPFEDVKLVGRPNLENVLAATAAANVAGCDFDAMKAVLTTFAGVKHRLEFLFKEDGVIYYNDSKATDIEATQAALSAFKQDVILLAGGLDRGDDLDRLVPDLKNVIQVIAFGETTDKVVAMAKEANVPVQVVKNVEKAAPVAVQMAKPGQVVLLSPAAASWDQYPNFEIRGDKYVAALKQALGKKD
ncbi:UDP-N-acetylmuramoyl-L-alanine--D-glutamate ligase [Fructobacillus sp. M2-14]|uniref:UDP-N-acetylmuramoylalanine--D-glutamate ligase n=1 Tax=Fructobacillus broussonetiae TaxID=2713173 RepID=A0ABS5QZ13_9LACO|nr:UDP-N-acetylmuramoyl-L-alanine--D-glutamate ligase [Fructobacillus broussonetiae]MBS9338440.1 UDP-N-acetylmuramoyl-L-alanine--D-glutamate ligase [Fructobacillus broussonetiae]